MHKFLMTLDKVKSICTVSGNTSPKMIDYVY